MYTFILQDTGGALPRFQEQISGQFGPGHEFLDTSQVTDQILGDPGRFNRLIMQAKRYVVIILLSDWDAVGGSPTKLKPELNCGDKRVIIALGRDPVFISRAIAIGHGTQGVYIANQA